MTWDEYRKNPGLNGSSLSNILKSPAYFRHCIDEGVGPTQDVTRVGTGMHRIVEALPDCDPSKLWRVMPDYRNDPGNVTGKGERSYGTTAWVREQQAKFRAEAAKDGIDVVSVREVARIDRMLRSLLNNREAMQIVTNSQREVSVVDEEIEGVMCKGRIDGLWGGLQWNLKCCTRGVNKRAFGFAESELHYCFKDAMHTMLLAEAGVHVSAFRYILLDDCIPYDSKHEFAHKFARPAECVVVDVPIDIIRSTFEQVRSAVRLYQECMESGEWPGVQHYEYIPWAPSGDGLDD